MCYIVKREIEIKYYKFIKNSTFFQLVKKYIVSIYKYLDHHLPDILKFDGWQKVIEKGDTIFSTELKYRVLNKYYYR